jgi:hypothetical protein
VLGNLLAPFLPNRHMYARRRRRHFGAVEETVSRSEHLVTL